MIAAITPPQPRRRWCCGGITDCATAAATVGGAVSPGAAAAPGSYANVSGRPRSKSTRSARISSADWYRISMSLASAASTIDSSCGGNVGHARPDGGGSSRTCLYATATGLSPVNGGTPVTIS